jgi:hypothetical protein
MLIGVAFSRVEHVERRDANDLAHFCKGNCWEKIAGLQADLRRNPKKPTTRRSTSDPAG